MRAGRVVRRLVIGAVLGATPPGHAAELWRGNFVANAHGLYLSPCRTGERLRVEDATDARDLAELYAALAERPGRPIFVELEGRREGRRIRAAALRRAVAGGAGCAEDLVGVRLRAAGGPPPWWLELRSDGARVRLGPASPMRFPAAAFDRQGGQWHYEAAEGRSVLRVRAVEERCRDPLARAVFPYRVTVEIDGVRRTGCGYPGDAGR